MRIEVKNLTKKYGKVVALDNVSLVIEHGMYGLLGPNGAGKTTLMRIMATTLQPTEGTVLYDDYDVTRHQYEIRKIIGYLPQDFRAFEGVRVRDFLEYVAILKQLPPRSIKNAIADVLDMTKPERPRQDKDPRALRRDETTARDCSGFPRRPGGHHSR